MADCSKQGFLSENFRLFHLCSPGGVTTELHYHEFCKILFFLRGRGEYLIDGKLYRLLPGDIVLLNAGSVHRAMLSPEEPYERIILYVLPAYLQKLSGEASDLNSLFSPSRVLRPREDRLSRLALRMEKDLLDDGFGKELLCRADLLKLCVYLGRALASSALSAKPLTPGEPRIRQILGYLEEHIAEDLTIDQLANRFFLSKYHMMRLFRAETGISIHQYITQKRLLLARSYLASGMCATESCYRSGFGSYSSFTRACKKLLGTTPTGRGGEAFEE